MGIPGNGNSRHSLYCTQIKLKTKSQANQTLNLNGSFKAKQRIVNLLGLALGLGVFLVIALIVTQKQVALWRLFDFCEIAAKRVVMIFFEVWLICCLKGEPSEGSILTAGEIFMRADNPADCNIQIMFTIALTNDIMENDTDEVYIRYVDHIHHHDDPDDNSFDPDPDPDPDQTEEEWSCERARRTIWWWKPTSAEAPAPSSLKGSSGSSSSLFFLLPTFIVKCKDNPTDLCDQCFWQAHYIFNQWWCWPRLIVILSLISPISLLVITDIIAGNHWYYQNDDGNILICRIRGSPDQLEVEEHTYKR